MGLGPTLQQPRVQLMLLGKASPLFSGTHPVAMAVSCHCVCHSSGISLTFWRPVSYSWTPAEGWEQCGNIGRNIPAPASHWKAFFGSLTSFPRSLPPPKRKANTMPVSSREISHTFSAAPDQEAKPV